MVTLPFGLELDYNAIQLWFYELYISMKPDLDLNSLLDASLSSSFESFTDGLVAAAIATLTALESWLKLIFYFCRLLLHLVLLAYPYIKPPVVRSYRYWNSLDLAVQLCVIAFLVFILISIHVKKNRYIQRTNHYVHRKLRKMKRCFASKWNKVICWISTRSKMAAKVFPHFVWWLMLCTLLWFIPQHIYALHHTLLFFFCFLFPSLRSYSIIRKYSHIMQSSSDITDLHKKSLQECISPLNKWLQFWSCRAFILFAYYVCEYLLSYLPTFILYGVNDYVVMEDTSLFEIIMDWSILWLLLIDSSLSFFATQLTAKIFQLDTNIRAANHDDSSSRRRTEIRSHSTTLADRISLSSINSLLSFVLKMTRPFLPTFIYNIFHDGLYQFLIFFSFIFISPMMGSYLLGYLLPIYTSILALHSLQDLQHKIALWNNDQQYDLITPHHSTLFSSSPPKNGIKHRKNGKNPQVPILSPSKAKSNRVAVSSPSSDSETDEHLSWSSWSLKSIRSVIVTPFNSFIGGESDKNERKRQAMHQEANYVIQTIVDRLKYWVVFASIEWMYYFVGEQVGLQFYIPFWSHMKFALILWIQLPYVPYSALKLYEYVTLPIRVLDITHSEQKKVEKPADALDPDDSGAEHVDANGMDSDAELMQYQPTAEEDAKKMENENKARESRSCSVEQKHNNET